MRILQGIKSTFPVLVTGAISYRLAEVGGVVWPAALLTSGEMLPNTRATPQNALECLCFLAGVLMIFMIFING